MWPTKARIQKLLSSIPLGDQLYFIGQQYVGGFRQFDISSKVGQGTRILESLSECGGGLNDCSVLEIGTGWAPIIPFLFWLCGQKECHTFDISALLKKSLVLRSARQLASYFAKGEIVLTKGGKFKILHDRQMALARTLGQTRDGKELLELCHVFYHAPHNPSSTGLDDQSVDLIFSNTVMQHVKPLDISRILNESHRILKPGGLMIHLIDMSDNFSHADPSITSINFLQFSEEYFQRFNSSFLFQNRWRASRWHEVIRAHGFEIVSWQPQIDGRALEALPTIQLDIEFSALSPTDICTSSVCVGARRP
jgi:SAM-dependent methyltransferase